MARMRTADRVYELIRKEDPETEVTKNYIRCLIKSGKFPVVPVGRKKLVDADAVIKYLATGEMEPVPAGPTVVGIRQVPVGSGVR